LEKSFSSTYLAPTAEAMVEGGKEENNTLLINYNLKWEKNSSTYPTPTQNFKNLKIVRSHELAFLFVKMQSKVTEVAFISFLRKKVELYCNKVSALELHFATKFNQLEAEKDTLLRTFDLFEDVSNGPNFTTPLSTVNIRNDGKNDPIFTDLKFNDEKDFKDYLEEKLSDAILYEHLTKHFPEWVLIREFIQRKVESLKTSSSNDDFLDSSSASSDKPIEEQDGFGAHLRKVLDGVRTKRLARKRGFRNKPKDEDEDEDEDVRNKPKDEDEDEDGDEDGVDDGKKIKYKDLSENSIRLHLLRFINALWLYFDFDVFGHGKHQSVKGLRAAQVQELFGKHLHQFLTLDQTKVQFSEVVNHASQESSVREIDLITTLGDHKLIEFLRSKMFI
jgi:hypothetical protein